MHAIGVFACLTLLLAIAVNLAPSPALAQSNACSALNGSVFNSPSNTVNFAPSGDFIDGEASFGDENPASADAFQPGETINWVISLTGTPAPPDGNVFFSVLTFEEVLTDLSYLSDGEFVDIGSYALLPGDGALYIIWTATPPGFTGTLTMRVWCTGVPSSDATLSALLLSAGALDPAFAPTTTAYTIDVPNVTDSTTVTPTAADAGATIEVNGAAVASGATSGSIALAEGPNLITIEVTAEDGVTDETYTVTVNRAVTLTLDPPAGALADGEVGTAYAETFVASGGSGNYSYAVTAGALPDGLTLAADGSLSGTPTTVETATFTVTASDVDVPANTGSAAYTLEILAAPGTLTLDPPAGALADGEVGTAYAETFVASGGSGNYSYAVTAGALPDGLTLAADGSLSGTPTTVETATFTVTASDVDVPANTGSAAYTLEIIVPPASSNAELANLQPSVGSLQPSFAAGTLTYGVDVPNEVETITLTPTATDPHATIAVNGQAVASGTASQPLTLAVGPNPIEVVVTAADGTTTRTYTVTVVRAVVLPPNPTTDPEVVGLLNAQARTASRFARTQIRNFHQRLERLHNERERRASSMNVRLRFTPNNSPSSAQRQIDHLIANSHSASTGMLGYGPVSTPAPSRQGDAQTDRSSPFVSPDLGPFAVWSGGFVNFGQRDGGGLDLNHTMVGVSGGIDYRFSERFVGGVGIGYGRDRTEIGANGTENRANAFSAALYGSYRPIDNLFVDGLLGAGWLDFESRRFVTPNGAFATGNRSGTQLFGSLTAAYEFRDDRWLISPYGRVEFARSWLHGFTETGGGVYRLTYGGQTIDTLSGVLGIRANHFFQMDWGILTPGIRAEYTHDFAGSSRASLGYTDLGGLPYAIETDPNVRDFVTLGLSLDMQFRNDWNLGVDYRTSFGGAGKRDHTFGARLGARF